MSAEPLVTETGDVTVPSSAAVVRQWARDNGLPVGDRGRLSPELLTAYAASGSPKPGATSPKLTAPARASRRRASLAVRVLVQPTPGAIGIAHRVAARVN